MMENKINKNKKKPKNYCIEDNKSKNFHKYKFKNTMN